MPAHQFMKKALIPLLVCTTACAAFSVGHWLFPRDRPAQQITQEEKKEPIPTCRIEFLTPQDRIARMNAPVEFPPQFAPSAQNVVPPHRVTLEQADNPALLSEHYATVRFENTTGRPLVLYVLRWVEGIGYDPIMENTAIVDVEVRDSTGQRVEAPHDPRRLQGSKQIPLIDVLRANNYPAFVLKPQQHINLPMSVFGSWGIPRPGPEPVTYTLRATVTYIEAPSGETKRITSEPVTLTFTEAHFKARDTYWDSWMAAQKK